MKVIITSKNIKTNAYLKETIEKKMQKLGKYFSDDIGINIMLSAEKKMEKIEATIKARGMIFRAESKSEDIYESLDKVVDKLSTQMSRFKSKLQKKHKGSKDLIFEEWPEPAEEIVEDIQIVKKKKFDLLPMTEEEAILQMELLEHNFYVFMDMETRSVNVVYKRDGDAYGLLETSY